MAALCLAAVFLALIPARAANTLNWETNQNRVSADVKSGRLLPLLEQIAAATRWHVFVEPDATTHTVSAKFSNLPPGDALHLLLGDLNFALVPETNAASKLFVFRTTMKNATQPVRPVDAAEAGSKGKLIPNELIVRLKPGAKIDELAKLLGAKVTGRIDSLNAYRLQFEDEAAADAARAQLASNPDVASVDSNYSIDRAAGPGRGAGLESAAAAAIAAQAAPERGRIIVGLVDTALQPLGNGLDSFLLKPISVAGEAQLDPNDPTHGTSMAETILRSLADDDQRQLLRADSAGGCLWPKRVHEHVRRRQRHCRGRQRRRQPHQPQPRQRRRQPVSATASSRTSVAKNIVFIAAAGNTPVTTPFYPAAYPEVMAVTAIDQGQLASYANRGSFVSLGAPGTSVVYFDNQPYS